MSNYDYGIYNGYLNSSGDCFKVTIGHDEVDIETQNGVHVKKFYLKRIQKFSMSKTDAFKKIWENIEEYTKQWSNQERCEHILVYSTKSIPNTNPPLVPWICRKCLKEGINTVEAVKN